MPQELSIVRYSIHKACAYPIAIWWIIGTVALWILLSCVFLRSGIFDFLLDDWTIVPLLLLSYAATLGLGFFVGAFLFAWPIILICDKFNGAPHEVGERVLILSGDRSGTAATVYEITTGQGGQPVPRVDLGLKAKEEGKDIYDECCLLRISPRTNG